MHGHRGVYYLKFRLSVWLFTAQGNATFQRLIPSSPDCGRSRWSFLFGALQLGHLVSFGSGLVLLGLYFLGQELCDMEDCLYVSA